MLDNLISLHQNKIEAIKKYKAGMLQKMFPREGETVPEIRFPGFKEEWEKVKLGEYVDITTGKLNANAMNPEGKYDFYTCGVEKCKIDYPAFKGPAITIAGNGAVGYMHLADGEFNAYQRTYVLTKFKINREFLYFEIGQNLHKKIAQETRIGVIPYIVLDMLTDLEISKPGDSECCKIAAFFQALDNLISSHQREYDKLKELKKGLLQQMFV